MKLEYFEMIDEVLLFDKGSQSIVTRASVPLSSPVFEGHFPGRPLMPGVLLIETMAQASGFLLLGLNGLARMPFLAGVEKAKMRRFVEPGGALTIEAKLQHEGSGYAVTSAFIRDGDQRVCDAELMFKVLPFPAELKAELEKRAISIGLLERAA